MSHCKYHPIVDAQYYCEYCYADVCANCCVEPSEYRQNDEHRCFVCNSGLEKLNLAGSIQPFWRRLPEIHRYPLNASGLGVIIFSSIVWSLPNIFGFFSALLPLIVMMMYCFACLNESTTGELKPPNFFDVIGGNANIVFSVLGISVISGVVISYAFNLFGLGIGIFVSILFFLSVPAIFMVLAVEQSMFAALNISKVFQIIRACGSSYLLMLLFLIILSGSMEFAISVVSTDSQTIFTFLSSAISSYYYIIIFHIMGYMVYQNSHALDFYTGTVKHEQIKARSDAKLAEMEVEILLKEGQFKQATEKFYQLLKQNKSNNLLWRKYFNLITETRNSDAIRQCADSYFDKLITDDDRLSLVHSYKVFKKIMPNFSPTSLKVKFSIAKAALENLDFAVVPGLLENVSKETDDKALLKKALRLMATAFAAMPEQEYGKKAKKYAEMAAMIDSSSLS